MTAAPPVLGALDPQAPLPFGRHSVVRAVVAEPVTALLVQRALIMDVAHPSVAAAVAHHSHFRSRPLTRAWVTVDAALRLVFGDEHTARGAARQIYGFHDHVSGTIHGHLDGAGAYTPDGADAYTAHDASLLAWVWATLVDTTETAFTRWVRPFEVTEATAFYAEMRSFARFLGIPDDLLPPDRVAFSRYLEDMVSGGLPAATEVSRSVARQVLWFDHRIVPSPLVRVERVLALSTLDPRFLDRLDIAPDAGDAALGHRIDSWLRSYYRRLPRAPRITPELYVLLRRPSVGLAGRARALVGSVRR
ncbi:MAG TPA: oxygenase MpaB family protein [Acidimicrobiales bacterium]